MTTSVLSVRGNEQGRALLEAASTLARTSLSDFIRRKALDAADENHWFQHHAWANHTAGFSRAKCHPRRRHGRDHRL